MKYQLKLDGRNIGPVRNSWRIAAQDAVNSGHATWSSDGNIMHNGMIEIERIDDDSLAARCMAVHIKETSDVASLTRTPIRRSSLGARLLLIGALALLAVTIYSQH